MEDVALQMKRANLSSVGRFLSAVVEGAPGGSVRHNAVAGAAASIEAHFFTHRVLSDPESVPAMLVPSPANIGEIPPAHLQDLSLVDGRGRSALWYAADFGDTALLAHLIACGGNVNMADRQAVYPLHAAVYNMRFDTVQLLLANGANVNALDHVGLTPLSKVFHADVNEYASNDRLQLVQMAKILLDWGACVAALGITELRQYGAGDYIDSRWN